MSSWEGFPFLSKMPTNSIFGKELLEYCNPKPESENPEGFE